MELAQAIEGVAQLGHRVRHPPQCVDLSLAERSAGARGVQGADLARKPQQSARIRLELLRAPFGKRGEERDESAHHQRHVAAAVQRVVGRLEHGGSLRKREAFEVEIGEDRHHLASVGGGLGCGGDDCRDVFGSRALETPEPLGDVVRIAVAMLGRDLRALFDRVGEERVSCGPHGLALDAKAATKLEPRLQLSCVRVERAHQGRGVREPSEQSVK